MVWIDNVPYLDGGCANRLPLNWVLEQGFKKLLVVRTQPKRFRREEKENNPICKFLYRDYPQFLQALHDSNLLYNQTCDELEQLERDGRILVIYPSGQNMVSRLEGDMEKLGSLYFEGLHTTQARIEEIKRYFSS